MQEAPGRIVARQIDITPLRYDVILPSDGAPGARPEIMRSLLATRLDELEDQAALVRAVLDMLDTLDSEPAERL